MIRSVSLFSDGELIGLRDFADYTEILRDPARPRAASEPAATADGSSLWSRMNSEGIGLRELQEQIERECITRALAEAGGNITRAADLLKMKRPRLSQLIKEYGIAL